MAVAVNIDYVYRAMNNPPNPDQENVQETDIIVLDDTSRIRFYSTCCTCTCVALGSILGAVNMISYFSSDNDAEKYHPQVAYASIAASGCAALGAGICLISSCCKKQEIKEGWGFVFKQIVYSSNCISFSGAVTIDVMVKVCAAAKNAFGKVFCCKQNIQEN